MRVRLLGTAAGGGFPQWNCHCPNCAGLRDQTVAARPRSQSCVAVSRDGVDWFLLNASPDIRTQIASFAPHMQQKQVRGTNVAGILLTNGDLDHTLGLFVLREGEPLVVHATSAVRNALTEGLSLTAVLERYCGVEWREPPGDLSSLLCRNGKPSGLKYAGFAVPGKPPRYLQGQTATAAGQNIGYLLVDEATKGRLLFMPGVAALDETVRKRMSDCDALLIDGTFWSDDEMQTTGAGALTAAEMGHLPVGGPGGSLESIARLPLRRKIYVHINNTNPMLLEDSAAARAVRAAGAEVGWDGLEFEL